jgi:hypothetical protein
MSLVSVVIPTFGGHSRIEACVHGILTSQLDGMERVEIIVVDDGSPEPVSSALDRLVVPPLFALCCLRQPNSGPAAARNAGFLRSSGDIVLFLDDDILVPPELLSLHVRAHRDRPGSVIVGRCPLAPDNRITPLWRYLRSLGQDTSLYATEEFIPIPVIASGQLSVERAMFWSNQSVYCSDLRTPAAEEFELSHRLKSRGIPVLLGTQISALHNHPVRLESICRQQFKHAYGCAEVALKYPDTLALPELNSILERNTRFPGLSSPGVAAKYLAKALIASSLGRSALLQFTLLLERLFSSDTVMSPLYHAAMTAHFVAGIRDGLQAFAPVEGAVSS